MALSFYLPASAGQLSAGQGGFMALGAYTAAYLTVQHGAPFPVALAAGALYAHYTLFIDPEAFGVGRSLFVMLYAVFGGLASFWGAVAGAAILSVLPELLRWVKDWREIFYGLLVLIMMLVRPQGLLDTTLLARLSLRGERAAARGSLPAVERRDERPGASRRDPGAGGARGARRPAGGRAPVRRAATARDRARACQRAQAFTSR